VPRVFGQTELVGLTSSAFGYVLVGTMWNRGFPRAATWYSADGHTWRRAVLPDASVMTSAAGVVSSSGDWILLTNRATTLGNEVFAWRSRDALTWRPLGAVGKRDEVGMGLCASDTTVLAIGHRPGPNLGRALAWRLNEREGWRETLNGVPGLPRACATFGASDVVLVRADLHDSQLWYRETGDDWNQGSFGIGLSRRILGLTAFERGFLAVGSEWRGGNEEFNAWSSAGGSHWTSLGGTVLASGEATFERGTALATDGNAIVAGGLRSTGAGFWIGPAP